MLFISVLHNRYIKIAVITVGLLFSFELYSQDSGDLLCEKPKYRPRKERHENCKDLSSRRQGLWKFFSYNGALLQEFNYKDNKLHGACTWYYGSTGRIRINSNYFDGKRDGEYESFFFNGQTQSQGEYVYGKRTGTWTFFYSTTGETRSTGLYINGKQSGLWKYYLSNGKMSKTVEYMNGQAVKVTYPTPPPAKVPALASPDK